MGCGKLDFLKVAAVMCALAGGGTDAVAASEDFDRAGLFRSSCAPCHGLTGHCGGPVAAALKSPVPSLATLTLRHDGTYPVAYLREVIDGRAEVKAHGSRIMPVWGSSFSMQHQGDGAEITVRFLIDALIEHIRTLQVK